jgi:hypothetical protein
MTENEVFELRAGDKVWGKLIFESDDLIVLEHSLTQHEVELCPGVALVDDKGQTVRSDLGEGGIRLYRPDGTIRHKIRTGVVTECLGGDHLDAVDVSDPKQQIKLEYVIHGAGYVFNLRWN